MADLFQDDWLSNLIGLCGTPEHTQKNNLISSFICGWLEALCIVLGLFKGVQPFPPARKQTFSASTETVFAPTRPPAPSWCSGTGPQLKLTETLWTQRALDGSLYREPSWRNSKTKKCAVMSKACFPSLWSLFSWAETPTFQLPNPIIFLPEN